MNYSKLQVSFILLLIMTLLQLLTSIFILHKIWLIITSIIAMLLCTFGIGYTLHKEKEASKKDKA